MGPARTPGGLQQVTPAATAAAHRKGITMCKARSAAFAATTSLLALSLAGIATAQTGPQTEPQTLELDAIVVSGGLTPLSAQALGRAVTVVTRETLEEQGVVYAVDALRGLPGVAVNRTGGPGGVTNVRLRGNEASHTLVLIDGIEVSAPENGTYDFSGLLAADIERIEILRGPQSSIFGSNAIGGVISIVTRAATEPGVVRGGGFEAMTDGSVLGNAYLRARGERGGISLSAAGQVIEGYDLADDGGDDDGDTNVTFNARGDYRLGENLTLGGTLRYVDRTADYDQFNFAAPDRAGLVTSSDEQGEQRDLSASVFAEATALGGRVEHGPFFSLLRADAVQRLDGRKTTDATGERYVARYQAKVALDAPTLDTANHSLTFAAEWKRETYRHNDARLVFDPSQLDEQRRDLYSLIGEYRGFFPHFDLQAAIRHDFNDDFRDETTYSAAVSVPVAALGARLHASVGTGVQNPTMIDQFGFFPGQFIGNPDLKPEKSFGWDIGIEKAFWDDRFVIDVTYFNQTLDDEIVTVYPAPDFIATAVNEDGESDRQGVEIAASLAATEALTLDASYTWLDATDPDGGREVRRPRHEGRISAIYGFMEDRGMLRVDGLFVRDNWDSDFTAPFVSGNTVKLEDYALVNVTASWQVNPGVEIYGGVNNLFDEDYEEVYGYAAQGITGFAGLRARF